MEPFSLMLTDGTRVLCQLSSAGEVDITVNMEKVLSKHDGPKDLKSLLGKYLYITVLLQEDTGTRTTCTLNAP